MIAMFYTLMFIIIITVIITEIRYKPRLDTAHGRKVIWYNISRYTNERDFIYLFDE